MPTVAKSKSLKRPLYLGLLFPEGVPTGVMADALAFKPGFTPFDAASSGRLDATDHIPRGSVVAFSRFPQHVLGLTHIWRGLSS